MNTTYFNKSKMVWMTPCSLFSKSRNGFGRFGVVAIAISIALLVFPASGNAEEKITSGLMALVGMKIPPVIPYKKQGVLPGISELGGFLVQSNEPNLLLAVSEGYIGNEGGFILGNIDKDMTRTVLDVRVLPQELLGYDLRDGKHIWRKDAIKKYSVGICDKAGNRNAIIGNSIIGLMRPERGKEGCLHYTRQVKMAWRVNERLRKLENISPTGLSCFFSDGEDECYN